MKSYKLKNGTKVYKYGNPIETGAVIEEKIEIKLEEHLDIRFKEGYSKISLNLSSEDIVYGLGGNLGGVNKRGRLYESYCTDEPLHIEDRTKLYSAHNFFIISCKESRGYFIDFPSRIKYDVGYYNEDLFNIKIYGKDFYIYIIEGENLEEISTKFLQIIGKSYIPPKWAFGYFQSR